MKIVVDTFAWIEILIGSQKGNKARKILAEAQEAYTPDVVLAEVARKYLREGVEEQVIVERLKKIVEASEIAPIDVEVALESAKCYIELSKIARRVGVGAPSLFDAIVLATTRAVKAKVVTGNGHFENLSETLWIGEPS